MSAPVTSPRRRRVLIVSPNFAPLNTPDMQRARLALPYLREHGWEPVVLAVAPEYSGTGVLDPLLEKTYPADIRVVRVRGITPRSARWLGVGSLWWRCGRALRRAGEALLAAERFELVFFTTTQFDAFTLGPRWLRQFGVPYVLDYQDPWINPFYHRTKTRPPGGWLKFNVTQWLARCREPAVVRQAAAIVSVSDSYIRDLLTSYPALNPKRLALLPFGASPLDLTTAAQQGPSKPLIDFTDGHIHHVYTGRLGPDMTPALTVILRAFRRFLDHDPAGAKRLRFHFIGTGYAPAPLGREWAMPIAQAEGVADFVREHCYRISYFDALHYLLNASALMIVGSTDPTYSASKLFPYVLARRPLLLVFPEKSLILQFAEKLGAGQRGAFAESGDLTPAVDAVYQRWFVDGGYRSGTEFDEAKFLPFTAASLTGQLAEIFDAATRRSAGSA